MRLCLIALLASVFVASAARGADEGEAWAPLFEDRFDREQLGANWLILRGDWRIEQGRLRITRQWPSDSVAVCGVPVPGDDVRCSVEVSLGEKDRATLLVRSGEVQWGGGGRETFFGTTLEGRADAPEVPSPGEKGICAVRPGKTYLVVLQVEGGLGQVTVDGKVVRSERLPRNESEVNRHFGITCLPNGTFGNVRLEGKAPSQVGALRANTAEENRRATVDASRFLDPADAAQGFQRAIDALPASGGAVLLPSGTFRMRRHLNLPSNVTLRGQGSDKTILEAVPAHAAALQGAETRDGVAVVTVADASGFKVGDAVCFGNNWGHPGFVGVGPAENQGLVVTAIAGNALTLSGPVPEGKYKVIHHWFPLIYSRMAEFVEVKDLTLRGVENQQVEASGGFQANPITMGSLYGARIHRVSVDTWKGDGVSLQGGADALVTDNTATRVAQGFHPGTTTSRFLWSRNLSTGNRACGLYFCWYNRNGVFFRNTLDSFAGYADAGDVFDTLACNRLLKSFTITTGYGGVFFGNECPDIKMNPGKVVPGKHLYGLPGRYFILARNRAASITLGEGTMGNILADNEPLAGGGKVEILGDLAKNLCPARDAKDGEIPFVTGIDRDAPMLPPKFPPPVLDGAKSYLPGSPDCGFQKALDGLAATGGTLLLPAGRYPLAVPLKVPSKVTLAGQGLGTVLEPAEGPSNGALVSAAGGEQVVVRDLVVRGGYAGGVRRKPAIELSGVKGARLACVDVRGWEGTGFSVSGGDVDVQDCRALRCAGDGFQVAECGVRVTASLATACRNGFVAQKALSSGRIEGNIAGFSREAGFILDRSPGVALLANNANSSGSDGVRLVSCERAVVAANTVMNNNQGLQGGKGIRLAGSGQDCRILYNNCSDEQVHPTQEVGIAEEEGGGRNEIRFNVTAPVYRHPRHAPVASLVAREGNSVVSDNQVETLLPSGSSIEALEIGFKGN